MRKPSITVFLKYVLIFLFIGIALKASGQSQRIKEKWRLKDSIRFSTDSLNGFYIPKDLDDCFQTINAMWNDSTQNAVRDMEESTFSATMHHGFGTWMRNNWGLYKGSRLSAYFDTFGIYHPDDMSGIILTSYHRFLNGKEIDLETQVKSYKAYWENIKMRQLKHKQTEFAEYEMGDTVLFEYPFDFISRKQENAYSLDDCIAMGQIIERNEEKFIIKVLLIESCGKRGIICYDNQNVKFYHPRTRTWKKKLRKKKHLKSGESSWFKYGDWEVKE